MTQFLHTRNMEEAARELHRRFPRVLIRNKNQLWNPLRLRRAQLQDLAPRIVLNPPDFDGEVDAWNREGGMMIYDRPYQRTENIQAHQAQLLSECPLSREQLYAFTEGTLELAVIYWPPNWNEHRRCVDAMSPGEEICRKFYDLVSDGADDAQLADLLGLRGRFTVHGEEKVLKALDVVPAHLWRIRHTVFRPREYRQVTRAVLRVPPQHNPTELQIYRYIEANCAQQPDGTYLIPGSMLNKCARFWKVGLRDMSRAGNIALKETLFCYLIDDFGPPWGRIVRQNREARQKMEEMIAFVGSLPEFIPEVTPLLHAPEAQARSSSYA